MKIRILIVSVIFALSLVSTASAQEDTGRWMPKPGTTWQWQLSTTPKPDQLLDVDAYDLDAFDAPKRTIDAVHSNGGNAICYVNVGAWEKWRPDKNKFPKSVLGNAYDGWAGERWLDIRKISKLAPVMERRLDLCAEKGFDAVEPDNMNGYENRTGFKLTYADQLKYNRWLAREAHERGMSIALKNTDRQVKDLVGLYDFAITEDCFDQGWCANMRPFVEQNKAVLAAEYTDTGAKPEKFCPKARKLDIDAILKKRDLGAWRKTC